MIVDERRVSLAATFLDGSDYEVYKATRAGFTTSFVIAAERFRKKGVICLTNKEDNRRHNEWSGRNRRDLWE